MGKSSNSEASSPSSAERKQRVSQAVLVDRAALRSLSLFLRRSDSWTWTRLEEAFFPDCGRGECWQGHRPAVHGGPLARHGPSPGSDDLAQLSFITNAMPHAPFHFVRHNTYRQEIDMHVLCAIDSSIRSPMIEEKEFEGPIRQGIIDLKFACKQASAAICLATECIFRLRDGSSHEETSFRKLFKSKFGWSKKSLLSPG